MIGQIYTWLKPRCLEAFGVTTGRIDGGERWKVAILQERQVCEPVAQNYSNLFKTF